MSKKKVLYSHLTDQLTCIWPDSFVLGPGLEAPSSRDVINIYNGLSFLIQLSCLKKWVLMFSSLEDFHLHFSVWEFWVVSWQFWFLCMYQMCLSSVKQNQARVIILTSIITNEMHSTVTSHEFCMISYCWFSSSSHSLFTEGRASN